MPDVASEDETTVRRLSAGNESHNTRADREAGRTAVEAEMSTPSSSSISEDSGIGPPNSAFCLAGILSLLGWNMILTTNGYFDARKEVGHNWATYNAVTYTGAMVLGQGVTSVFPNLSNFHRLTSSLLISGVSFIMIPTCAFTLKSEVASLLSVILFGFANSVYQITIFSLSSNLPASVPVALSTGQGISGVLTASLSLLKPTASVVWIFFGIVTALTICASIYQYPFFQKHALVGPLLHQGRNDRRNDRRNFDVSSTASESHLDVPLRDICCSESGSLNMDPVRPRREVMRDIAPLATSIFLILFFTFCVFPSVTTHWKPSRSGQYQAVLVGTFQVFDILGRYAPTWPLFLLQDKKIIHTIVLSRIVFIPFFIGIQYASENFPDPIIFISMAIFAFTNGWCCSLIMILAPQNVRTEKERDTSGSVISASLCTGIFAGSCIGMLIERL